MALEDATSLGLRRKVCAAAANHAFAAAEFVLAEIGNVHLSSRQIQRIATREGQRLHELETPLARPLIGPDADAPPAEILALMADGGRCRVRGELGMKDHQWREPVFGAVLPMRRGEESADGEWHAPEVLCHTTVGKLAGGVEELGERLRAEAEAIGIRVLEAENHAVPTAAPTAVPTAKRDRLASAAALPIELVFVSDCAPSLIELQRTHFPHATRIADWIHADKRLHECAAAAFPDDPIRREIWREQTQELLWAGEPLTVARRIERHSKRLGEPPAKAPDSDPRVVLHRAVGYFRGNADAMKYAEFRARGLPISSSHIESLVKRYGRRIKATDKFWSEAGADAIIDLCALAFSTDHRWHRYWQNYSHFKKHKPCA